MAGITRFSMVQTYRMLCLRNPLGSRVRCLASGSQPPLDAARRGVEEVKKVGNQVKEQVVSQAENVANLKDAAGKVAGTAETVAEKAKKSAQDAWNVAKDKAQKVKENVSEKAEEAAGAVKENVDAAKRKLD